MDESATIKPHHWDRLKEDEHHHCDYCGDWAEVGREPFGGKLACSPCWCEIVYGSAE